jgi:hypothetical protein
LRLHATRRGSAATVGIVCSLAVFANLFACARGSFDPAEEPPADVGFRRHQGSVPGGSERYCAWYGDARGGHLYFGVSAFWSSARATGRPTADLDVPGPRLIGRFDLETEQMLPALVVGSTESRSGVWDVLAHPDGRVYFTTFFGSAGRVDPQTGLVQRFDGAGRGLNELELGPDGSILATRYGRDGGASGSVVGLDPEGRILWEHPLSAPEGLILAPKSLAYDPLRGEVWLTSDLLRGEEALPGPEGHPALVLDRQGRERLRISQVELQFVAFSSGGVGYLAFVEDRALRMAVLTPDAPAARIPEQSILLDPRFPTGLDFVQDIKTDDEGRVVVTRWSGRVHVVGPERVNDLSLPRREPDGLYYTGVTEGARLCVTYCDDVSVVCTNLEPAPLAP